MRGKLQSFITLIITMILYSFHQNLELTKSLHSHVETCPEEKIMRSSATFVLDGKLVTEDFSQDHIPTTTVLNYLRSLPTHKGVKEGCAEGDCGACTVVLGELGADDTIRYKSVDSCLIFLPMIHGKHLVTVENLKLPTGELHPVQQAMVDTGGSQCGYCTPGIIMSMFSLYKNVNHPSRQQIDDALTGNLCRCTGYKPIVQAAADSCVHDRLDSFTSDEPRIVELLRSIPRNPAILKSSTQTYLQPKTLLEALTYKHQYPEAIVMCGATDVALRVTKKHELLERIIDLSCVDEIRQVQTHRNSIRVGAAAVLSELYDHLTEDFASLRSALDVFGSQQIRNLATLGGNLGSASPIGDMVCALMPYNPILVLKSTHSTREIQLDSFLTGYRQTVRKPDELITEIVLTKPSTQSVIRWYKVSKRKDLDISTLSGSFKLDLGNGGLINSATLVYGGMAERVKRATSAEKFLRGKLWTREVVEQAMPLIDKDFTPISDARGSAEFRRIAARNLLLKFWNETTHGNGQLQH